MYISFSCSDVYIECLADLSSKVSLLYPFYKTGGPGTSLNGHMSIRDSTLTSHICITTANKNQEWHGEATLLYLNTIAINALYIDREEDAYSP